MAYNKEAGPGPRGGALLKRLLRGAQLLLGLAIFVGFFAGWILAVGSALELRDLHAARAWPAKEGVITHSYARRIRGHMNRPSWHAEIAGRYADGSGTFSVSRHGFGIQNAVNTRSQAEAVTKRYPKGMTLPVYPEPRRPRSAILDRDASPAPSWIALGASIGLILLPFVLYLFGRWRRR